MPKNPKSEKAFSIVSRAMFNGATGNFNRGYHLEFPIDNVDVAHDICEKLSLNNVFTHISTAETGRIRVYIKDCESICNLLALVGATRSLCELNNQIALRAVRNTTTRKTNCDTHNISRQIAVAAEQVKKISAIMSTPEFENLPKELQETARIRIKNPNANYEELAAKLGISKSGVVHRIGRILMCFRC